MAIICHNVRVTACNEAPDESAGALTSAVFAGASLGLVIGSMMTLGRSVSGAVFRSTGVIWPSAAAPELLQRLRSKPSCQRETRLHGPHSQPAVLQRRRTPQALSVAGALPLPSRPGPDSQTGDTNSANDWFRIGRSGRRRRQRQTTAWTARPLADVRGQSAEEERAAEAVGRWQRPMVVWRRLSGRCDPSGFSAIPGWTRTWLFVRSSAIRQREIYD